MSQLTLPQRIPAVLIQSQPKVCPSYLQGGQNSARLWPNWHQMWQHPGILRPVFRLRFSTFCLVEPNYTENRVLKIPKFVAFGVSLAQNVPLSVTPAPSSVLCVCRSPVSIQMSRQLKIRATPICKHKPAPNLINSGISRAIST